MKTLKCKSWKTRVYKKTLENVPLFGTKENFCTRDRWKSIYGKGLSEYAPGRIVNVRKMRKVEIHSKIKNRISSNFIEALARRTASHKMMFLKFSR